MTKIIPYDRYLSNTIGKLGKETLTNLPVTLAKDTLTKLANKWTLSILDKLERKISGRGAIRVRKWFSLFFSNEDMNDIITIVKSLKKSGLLIDGTVDAVKNETRKSNRKWSSSCFECTYGCFIDSHYGIFIDKT